MASPSRGELRFRLGFSPIGLGMMVGAVLVRGLPTGPAGIEVFGIAGAFFGGTAIWSWLKLRKSE